MENSIKGLADSAVEAFLSYCKSINTKAPQVLINNALRLTKQRYLFLFLEAKGFSRLAFKISLLSKMRRLMPKIFMKDTMLSKFNELAHQKALDLSPKTDDEFYLYEEKHEKFTCEFINLKSLDEKFAILIGFVPDESQEFFLEALSIILFEFESDLLDRI